MIVSLLILSITAVTVTALSCNNVSPLDTRLTYSGRWEFSDEPSMPSMKADWPCTAIKFNVNSFQEDAKLEFIWSGVRVHLNVSIWNKEENEIFSQVYESPDLIESEVLTELYFPTVGDYTIIIRKLTCAAPYGMGIGSKIIKESALSFYGIKSMEGLEVTPSESKRRRIEFIGASDTQGYCVDGSPDMDDTFEVYLGGYKFDNCELAYPGLLASQFDADYHIEAIAGIGLTQNAGGSKHIAEMGPLPMPDLYNRTIQLLAEPVWDFSLYRPDLVTISLGGNDYNHQDGNVPSNETFSLAMEDFYLSIFDKYDHSSEETLLKIVSICGMGDPFEASYDPDNSRCRPCPHVSDAVVAFKLKYPTLAGQVYYINVPCDGSVVTGKGDIGCMGHKNREGQNKVADFLFPLIRDIMKW
mmetsp:Transcript_21172/g.35674  ORF Transcript_21172/g.35674 Transcript_21172/m.35674 type:complete len:414 (-) Transcript_21172:82-1323(-)